MKFSKNILRSLYQSQYLNSHCLEFNLESKHILDKTTLLENGQKLKQELLIQWLNTTTDWAQTSIQEAKTILVESKGRLAFLHCKEFQKSCQQLCRSLIGDFNPIILKKIEKSSFKTDYMHPHFQQNTTNDEVMNLVSYYFLPVSSALDKFYSIQRERKIWWMRYSANPSRYFLEPFSFSADDAFFNKCNSITIKSNLFNDMESITLVPLNEIKHDIDGYNQKPLSQIYVVRSVINLDWTTRALILDACENGRENTLMLNRKLAPFQILIGRSAEDGLSDNLSQLSLHIEHVLLRAGLRLYDKPVCSNTEAQLLNTADSLGVPYVLLLDANSIKTGLIKLRSRDTTLSETIHITDLPNYLLNIFKH